MMERHGLFAFPSSSSLLSRCDGWSYSGNNEATLRTKAVCQGQQTRKTEVAWDIVGTIETL